VDGYDNPVAGTPEEDAEGAAVNGKVELPGLNYSFNPGARPTPHPTQVRRSRDGASTVGGYSPSPDSSRPGERNPRLMYLEAPPRLRALGCRSPGEYAVLAKRATQTVPPGPPVI